MCGAAGVEGGTGREGDDRSTAGGQLQLGTQLEETMEVDTRKRGGAREGNGAGGESV